jgi:hypothetical protein
MVSVSFHLRGSDHRTRILCASHVSKSAIHYSTMPITSLMIDREGSALHLYRKIFGTKKLEIWATLQFNTTESQFSHYSPDWSKVSPLGKNN